MSNAIYPLAKQRLLEWAFNGNGPGGAASLCVIGVKSGYVYSASHSTLADVSGSEIIVPESPLGNPTFTLGVIDADDEDLSGMTTGQTLDAFIVYMKWASATLLLCYMDTASNGSIPTTINASTGLLQFPVEGIMSL